MTTELILSLQSLRASITVRSWMILQACSIDVSSIFTTARDLNLVAIKRDARVTATDIFLLLQQWRRKR